MIRTILLLSLITLSVSAQTKIYHAVHISSPIIIDGALDEPVWQNASAITDFTEQEPKPGNAPSEKTSVKVLYDGTNIYIGAFCYDREPSKIVARELKWDGRMSADDNFQILFDTFNDDKNAYWFATNPMGMHDDALTSGSDFSNFNESWNGLWDVRCAVTDSGWCAEFIFPVYNFKFDNKEQQVWGVNFSREIRRKGETINWAAIGVNSGFWHIPFAGDLVFEGGLKRGDPVFVKPFISAGIEKNENEKKQITKAGLDIKYPVTRNLTLDVSFNSDFAQVEADKAQINLTRFPLFFPEKRDFFLEGANIFNFGMGGSNQLFYSRRIGLKSGKQIPIINGIKMVGKVNNTELGVLNVITNASNGEPYTNYSVLRAKQDFLDNSYYGFLVTNKFSRGSFNSVFAGDMELSFKKFLGEYNLIVGSGAAYSNSKNNSPGSWAGKVYVDFPNDFLDINSAYRFIQNDFNPEMGFISRTGIQMLSNSIHITPRINSYGIKKLIFSPIESSVQFDDFGRMVAGEFNFIPFGFNTAHGDEFEIEIERRFDDVEADFDFFKDYKITRGRYWFTRYTAEYQVGKGADLIGGAGISTGDYYDRKGTGIYGNLYFNPNSLFTLEMEAENNYFSKGAEKFSTLEFSTAARLDFSTRLFTLFQAQWKNESDEVGLIYRINYQPQIGSNIYLVVNHTLNTAGKLKTSDITVLGKIAWLFNL